MKLLQIIFILVSLIMIAIIISQFRKNSLRLPQLILWLIIWGSLFIGAILLSRISYIVNLLGITRPVDLFVYTAIIVLFMYTYKLHIKIEQQNQQITKLVRLHAITKPKKKK